MKEIFVLSSARGKGVGRALFAGLLDRAEVEGCVRLDWQTDGGNAPAQAFYASIGAPKYEKTTYRIMAGDFDLFQKRLRKNG